MGELPQFAGRRQRQSARDFLAAHHHHIARPRAEFCER
jgi:hypothetical protein